MFADYISAVVADYRTKKEEKKLSFFLSDPTPARLKEECGVVCEERYIRKDDRILKAFFKQSGDKATCLQAIKRCEIDRFRPLIAFLNGRIKSPDEINIELLAWLIDFKPRPYDDKHDYTDMKIPGKSEEVPEGEEDKVVPGDDFMDDISNRPDESVAEKDDPVRKLFNFGLWEGIVVIALIIVIIVGIRFCTGAAPMRPADSVVNGACMFWDEDHYESTPCSPRPDGVSVMALDSNKLRYFRKITRPDTITEASAGKVWYVKYNRDVEFYTDSGYHPLDNRLRLRPATPYMIRKYCHSDQ